jgi:type II secretion system protein N
MNRALLILAGTAWFATVFSTTLYFTFPSEPVANFVAHSVDTWSGGQYKVEMSSTRPWWVGLAADNVIVSSVAGGADTPFLFADALGVRIHPWALLRRGRQFSGYAQLEDGSIDAQIAAVDEDGEIKLRRVAVVADDISFETLAGFSSSATPIEGAGSIDLEVDLNMKEGLEKAQGEVNITGEGLRINKVAAPSMGLQPQDIDVAVTELDIRLSGEEGILAVTRGIIRSQLANIDIGGEVTLGDRADRSRVRLDIEVELGDWGGTPLEAFRTMVDGFTASAKCDDGRLHYSVNTTLGRFGFNDLRPERCKSSSRPSRAAPALGAPPAPLGEGAAPPPPPLPSEALPPTPSSLPERPQRPQPVADEPEVPVEGEGELENPEGEAPAGEEPPPEEE